MLNPFALIYSPVLGADASEDDVSLVADVGDPDGSSEVADSLAEKIGAQWYVVQVYAGFESQISEEIRQIIKEFPDLGIVDVLVPTQEFIQVQRGVKVKKERPFMPGYVLLRMKITSEGWQKIVGINKVSGFLGGKQSPQVVPDGDAERLMKHARGQRARVAANVIFHVGSSVRVCDGPFIDFSGTVEEVDAIRERLKVSVTIFGRATLVDLDFTQVETENT